MAQQESSSRTIAGASTFVGLGLVWIIVAGNFPSQEELFPTAPPAEARQVVRPLSSLSVPPTLDLTIPTSPPRPSAERVNDVETPSCMKLRLKDRACWWWSSVWVD